MDTACVPFGDEWFFAEQARPGSGPTTGSDGGNGPVGHDHWACRLYRLPCTRRRHGAPGSSRPTGQAMHLVIPPAARSIFFYA